MTVDLHPGLRDRLVELVAEALASTQIRNNIYPDEGLYTRLKAADEALPERQDEVRQKLFAYVNDAPVENFVFERLHTELDNRFEYNSDVQFPLTDVEGYEDPEQAAGRFVSELESLPWQYELMLQLPRQLGNALLYEFDEDTLQLSDELALRVFNEQEADALSDDDQDEPALGALLGVTTTSIQPARLTFVKEAEGYIGEYTATRPSEDFKLKLRSILGVLLALRLAVVGHSTHSGRKHAARAYRVVNGSRERAPDQSFSPEFSREFRALHLNRDFPTWPPKMRLYAATKARNQLQALFAQEEETESVIRGAQWLFDGYCSGNNLLAFVQTTVAIEILLGEDKKTSDLVGLSNLIGNRCAYLIATSRDERQEVMNDFRRAYSIRSKIVHEGKNRLSASERAALNDLRWMAYRVIQEELKLITD